MSRRRGFSKKRRFCNFKWPPQQNFQMAVNRTILILEGLPMAHLKAYVPNFPKHMRERSQSLKLWVLDLSEVRWSEKVAAQNAVFSAIFERKCSLTAKPSIFDPIVLHIFGKLCIWGFQKSGSKSIFDIPWRVRISVTPWHRSVTLIWFGVLVNLSAENSNCLLCLETLETHFFNVWVLVIPLQL